MVEIVAVTVDGTEKRKLVRAKDVSVLGIFLHDKSPDVAPGDLVRLRFPMDVGGTVIDVQGRVVRRVGPLDTADESLVGIGVEFVDVPPWAKQEIARYVEEGRWFQQRSSNG